MTQGEADGDQIKRRIAKRQQLTLALNVGQTRLLAPRDEHSDTRIESNYRRSDRECFPRNDSRSRRNIKNAIAFAESSAGEHLPSIPVAGSEREKGDCPVVPGRAAVK